MQSNCFLRSSYSSVSLFIYLCRVFLYFTFGSRTNEFKVCCWQSFLRKWRHCSHNYVKFDNWKLNGLNVMVEKRFTRIVADRRRRRVGDCSGIIGFIHIKKENNSSLALTRGSKRDSRLHTSDQWTKKKQTSVFLVRRRVRKPVWFVCSFLLLWVQLM